MSSFAQILLVCSYFILTFKAPIVGGWLAKIILGLDRTVSGNIWNGAKCLTCLCTSMLFKPLIMITFYSKSMRIVHFFSCSVHEISNGFLWVSADNDLCNQTARYRRNPAKCYDFDTRVRFTNLYFTMDLYYTIVCMWWILFRLIPYMYI